MATTTMSFALPEELRDLMLARMERAHYGNSSEYVRDLVRRDLEQEKIAKFRELIAEGLAAPAEPITPHLAEEVTAEVTRAYHSHTAS